MKEFGCRVPWPSGDEQRESAFTHQQWSKNGRKSQLENILSRCKCSTQDHSPVHAVVEEGEGGRGYVKKKNEKARAG